MYIDGTNCIKRKYISSQRFYPCQNTLGEGKNSPLIPYERN